MDVKEAIERRRSVRRFNGQKIADDIVDELIDAGRLAPSGSNTQPLRVFVVKEAETKAALQEAGAFAQGFVHEAPLILVICGDPNDYEREGIASLKGKGKERCLRDLSIASGFIVLRAAELGLSSCWIGMIDPPVIKKVLGIEERFSIPYVICLGYPREKPGPMLRKPLNKINLGEK